MPLRIIDHDSSEYHQMTQLRDEILRKPLGLYFDPEETHQEKEDILIGAFEEDQLIGCCMLTPTNGQTCRLRQMAVISDLQKKGIGASLINFAENVARDKGYHTMIMHARKSAIGFYQKFGYSISGDEFQEVSIPHYVMKKALR